MTNTYKSRDFYASAFIISQGIELKRHLKSGGFTTFEFEDSPKLQELIHKFYSLQASAEPVSFCHAIKSLKTIIHFDLSNTKTNTNKL